MLCLVQACGEDLAQQLFEPDLPDRAAKLRHLEERAHLGDGLAHGLEPARGLGQLPEAFAHVAHGAAL